MGEGEQGDALSIGDLLNRYGHGLILRETAPGLYRIDETVTDELARCLDCPSAHSGEVSTDRKENDE